MRQRGELAEGPGSRRRTTRRAKARGARSGSPGAATLIGVAALVVSALPASAVAAPASGTEEVVPGQRTAAPALVSGIRERVKATGGAADAARRYLADKESRYGIPRPDRDLEPVRTVTAGDAETVRLRQKHRGVAVFGAQYVVRMERKGGERFVTGTSGRYFTGLKVAVEPEVDGELAAERAVEAVEARLGPWRPGRDGEPGEGTPEPLTGTAHGLVVLPRGAGVLTHHVTVRGTAPGTGAPVLREVYVEARSGYPVLQYSGIQSFSGAGPGAASGAGKAAGSGTSPSRAAGGVRGSGVRLDGETVGLAVERDDARGEYVLRDRTRAEEGGDRNQISTWDARDRSVSEVWGTWPPGLKEFGSPEPDFGKEATEAGAVDAHWGAAKVHDYYKSVHGRDGSDGRGAAAHSLVGIGWGFANEAVWDGTKAMYGKGDAEHRPVAAALDVVGHTMTKSAVENSAGLVNAGQPGSVALAFADYFGNAVDTDAHGTPMDSPASGLVGEALCREKGPRECAARDMNDGRTTSTSFLGVSFATDNGGVHANSTLFSGALWDIREDLDRTLADRIAHKALTEYMTPLDGFTEGRHAVVAAAKDLKVTGARLRSVERAFDAHGIVAGWETAMGVDSDRLFGGVNTDGFTSVGAGGGWWAAAGSNEDGSEAYSVWAGRLDGTGEKIRVSPNDGRYHADPVTDGKTVVWHSYRGRTSEVLARPLAGGPVRKLFSNSGNLGRVSSLSVEGKLLAFTSYSRWTGPRVMYMRMGDDQPVVVPPVPYSKYGGTDNPSLKDGRIAFATSRRVDGLYRSDTEVLDTATGKRTTMGQPGTPEYVGPTAITGKHVYWLAANDPSRQPTAVRRADLDGTGTVDISPAEGKDALRGVYLTASDDAVTVGTESSETRIGNGTLGKLWQLSPDGSRRSRVSCNRGEQFWPVTAGGRRVVWLDATTGSTDLVTRSRPAGACG
ncbi:M4 family metallopeptidase [Streptomyces albireticuli]|uniref:M4 family metallopeptidase n=1 Tax=Streptomyces albireticuli TaxID=1940 RepID=UPI000B442F8D|nr:M4 family metallopeptidase [Streptomyces albireticuli]